MIKTGPFFRATHGPKMKCFLNSVIGKNYLGQVGIEMAKELLLPHPETYTGHCWRRSAGTKASDNEVNVTTLMSSMGWACPKTAMEYVNHSRVTSLTMSMYFSNVQRRNIRNPFETSVEERNRRTIFPSEKKEHRKLVTDLGVFFPMIVVKVTKSVRKSRLGCYSLTLGGRREFENLISLKV